MSRFETEALTQQDNLAMLTKRPGMWIDRLLERRPMRELVLDLDSSVSETYGAQEGRAYNGHFECSCYHPLFCFNQFGDVEGSLLREGNVHRAKDWRDVLEPVVTRYRGLGLSYYFRADAAFANPEIDEFLEKEGYGYAIRLPALRYAAAGDRTAADPSGGTACKRAGGLVYGLSVSGAELESCSSRRRQGGMAQGGVVPPHRIHRHQSEPVGQTGGAVLQPAGDGGTVHQGRQKCGALDPPVVP